MYSQVTPKVDKRMSKDVLPTSNSPAIEEPIVDNEVEPDRSSSI